MKIFLNVTFRSIDCHTPYTALKAKEKIYQTEVSKDLISTVTDGVIEEVNSW